MAQSGKRPYGKYGVYGSLAYDFKPVGNEMAGDYGNAQEAEKKPTPNIRKLRGPAVPVAAILSTLLLFAGLMSQSSLVALSDETYALHQEIDELMEIQKELKIEHAMAFSLSDTEEYALEVLGMQKPAAEQIYYLELRETEEQLSEETSKRERLDFLSFLREYFPG